MKALIVLVAILMLTGIPSAQADFEKAEASMEKGDFAGALEHWRPLADVGHAPSQHRLGSLYSEGICFPQNYKTAADWYRKSAEQGYAPAQVNLGEMYEMGLGVPQDESQARDWYKRASEQGHELAKTRLGELKATAN